jgi:hypothetical protein
MTYDAGREVDGARRARPGVGAKGAKGNTEQPESVRSWPNLPPASPCGRAIRQSRRPESGQHFQGPASPARSRNR